MPDIEEAHLPGVGVRHDLVTQHGERIGVLNKLGGERELLVYSAKDPDACQRSLRLEENEAEALAQLLGVTRITQSLASVREAVGSLQVEWLTIAATSPYADQTIGATTLRTSTGVSVVAVTHGSQTLPAPGPEQPIHAGDTLLVVGTLEGVAAAKAHLAG